MILSEPFARAIAWVLRQKHLGVSISSKVSSRRLNARIQGGQTDRQVYQNKFIESISVINDGSILFPSLCCTHARKATISLYCRW